MRAEEFDIDISRLLEGPDTAPRSKGLHVSTIYRDIEHTMNGDRPPDSELSPSELKRLGNYRAMGFAWERAIEHSLVDAFATGTVIRPGEFTLDGIHCTPDLFDIEDYALEEWKATWRSMNRIDRAGIYNALDKDFWVWGVQMKAYLRVLQTRRARLRVFFVNGDYRESGPRTRGWQLDFTQKELDDNWAMLVNHARRRGWLTK